MNHCKLVLCVSVQWPRNPEFSNPSKYGLEGVRNFYLTTTDGIQLGVWHILPESLKHTPNTTSDEIYENLLDGSDNIVIYNHGNSGHRIAPHRVELYKLLRKHFHVIAYDYRSTYFILIYGYVIFISIKCACRLRGF